MTTSQNDGPRPPPPWKLELRSSKFFVVTVVAIAVFTDVYIYAMIVPILPAVLKTRVGMPDNQLQKWMAIILAAFGGAVLFGSPIWGYYADKGTSRRVPFMAGLVALAGSTVMFWLARTTAALVVARVLQGLSSAVVWTVGMALVVDTVGKDETGVAMGYVSMAMTVGTVSGPFLGGIVLAKASYHAVFAMAVGLIVLDILLRLVMIEKKTASEWLEREPDHETEGLLSSQAGDSVSHCDAADPRPTPVEDDTAQEPDHPGEHTSGGRAGLPGLVRIMFSGSMLVVLLASLVNAMVGSSFDAVLPLFVIRTFHWGPFLIGVTFIPLFIPSISAPLVGKLVDRYGARGVAFSGFLLNLPVFLLLQIVKKNTTEHQVLLYIFLFLSGVASNLQNVGLMVVVNDVTEQMEKEHPGIFGEQGGTGKAYGLYNVAWSGGQVFGPLFAGYLVEQRGWATMVTVFGILCGGVAVLLGVTRPKR